MSHPLVLLVDDMADVRELVRRTLTPSGYQVCECADGAAAIAMARHMRPAVILLDLGLPGLDGWEVASIIHTDPVNAATPIIGLTGWSSPRAIRAAEDAGCRAIICKPFNIDHLIDTVHSLTCG